MILKINTSKQDEVVVQLNNKDGRLIDEIRVKRLPGSQVLIPTIMKILKKNRLSPKDLGRIEVNEGPGSFTGLRVGISVANALGHFLKIPVNNKKGKIIEPKYE